MESIFNWRQTRPDYAWGFPGASAGLKETRSQSHMDRAYMQFPLAHPKDVASGLSINIPDAIWASIAAKPANTDAKEIRRLWDIIDKLLDHHRVSLLQYNQARWHEEVHIKLRAATQTPHDPFTSNPNDDGFRYLPPGLNRRNNYSPVHPFNPMGPSSPTKRRSPIEQPVMDGTRSVGRQKPKHKRTETPEQLHLKPFIQKPVYTVGIDPQSSRGLLHDYFEDIRKWAGFYIRKPSAGGMEQCPALTEITSMLEGRSDVQDMLADSETLKDIFTGCTYNLGTTRN
ncbi:unnamed protein product [Periconia digitata]|uniref:Uncharacterized protein n=1 Tax=Periconia digitata TaxID=1303443 RepID=A0A9W4ULM4_9PLEO|nr:unnamed protein product [Periconia digitata]